MPKKIKVLIAEDNVLNQKLILTMLKKLDMEADTALDGYEVLEALKKQEYDAILMDCLMPNMNGYEATTEIRALDNPKKDIPVIALTANIAGLDKEECVRAGMNEYLSKPVKIEGLRASLEKVLNCKITEITPKTPRSLNNRNIPLDPNRLSTLYDIGVECDSDVLQEVIGLFIDLSPSVIETIKKGMIDQDFECVRKSAHKLKGGAQNIGALDITETCLKIEASAQSKSIENLSTLVNELEEKFNYIVKFVDEKNLELVINEFKKQA